MVPASNAQQVQEKAMLLDLQKSMNAMYNTVLKYRGKLPPMVEGLAIDLREAIDEAARKHVAKYGG